MKFAHKVDKTFVYVPANRTNIAETFKRVRKQQAEAEQRKREADQVVKPIRKKA